MSPHLFISFLRSIAIALLALTVTAVVAACGRSDLDDYLVGDGGLTDARPPPNETGPGCNATSCAAGCCDPSGVCQPGNALNQCGGGGEACSSCPALGFQSCDATKHACANQTTSCGPATCGGCCVGNTCFAGTDTSACGLKGSACQTCVSTGAAECTAGQCVTLPSCGPANCGGCCFGNECITGGDPTACGHAGAECVNCVGEGLTCVVTSIGGTCEATSGCGPQNCGGCCSGNVCLAGSAATGCGVGGAACVNCASVGESCFGQQCGFEPCGPSNCGGCCDFAGVCEPGNFSTSCGGRGQACEDCQTVGETCQGQACVPGMATCSAANCKGCCDAFGDCETGNTNTACGVGGIACGNCAEFGDTCDGSFCVPTPCGPGNCAGCCDASGTCQFGGSNNACGLGGLSCTNCSLFGDVCDNEECVSPCSAANCSGCCDATGTCQAGFLDTQCGGNGNSCLDCATLVPATTCNTASFPPSCTGMSCPGPYAGCAASLSTPSPVLEHVCSASDLANAAAACAAGSATSSCGNFFNFEFTQNPACGQCLSPFDVDFSQLTGVSTCVEPFVSAACNHATACESDCESSTCVDCSDETTFNQCTAKVATGPCATLAKSAQQCESAVLAGGAAFCNPASYASFGAWLQGVGTFYCGGFVGDAGLGAD